MLGGARRLLLRFWGRAARRALLALCLLPAGQVASETIVAADYASPTSRYPHAVLGDDAEYGSLVVTLDSGKRLEFVLPDTLVFEDTLPRLVDLDADSAPEVIVVESDQFRGARLAIYGAEGRITATEFIGTRFRWLAPIGAADLDGDGVMEIAYIDRPHLAKILRVWRYAGQRLQEVVSYSGLTNHRIGETDIAGGIRTCAGFPEMILANADWTALMAARLDVGKVEAVQIGTDTSRAAFARAMSCDP